MLKPTIVCFESMDMPGWEYCPWHGRRVGGEKELEFRECGSSELQLLKVPLGEPSECKEYRNYYFTSNL